MNASIPMSSCKTGAMLFIARSLHFHASTYRLLRGDLLPGEKPGKDRSDADNISVDTRVHRGVVLVVRVEDPVEAAAGEGDLALHEVDAELSRQGGVVLHGVPADVVQLSGRRRLHVVDADAAVGEQAVLGSLALDALGLEEARYGRVCVPVSQVLKWVSRRVNLLFINYCI